MTTRPPANFVQPAPAEHTLSARRSERQIGTVCTNELFGGAREILIEHSGVHYRLRITANDKLILTK